MKNAEKFKEIFKEFATEVWAFPEKDFLTWLNAEYIEPTNKNDLGDEYISRSELMAILSDYYDTTVEYRSMLKEIAALPSVTPQELILDKIRAEIEQKIVKRPWLDFEDRERDRNDAFLEVLDIIDKHKAEQEKT